MTTEITKYGSRNWAVWLLGPDLEGGQELVAVTMYKRGALSVQAMADRLIELAGRGIK